MKKLLFAYLFVLGSNFALAQSTASELKALSTDEIKQSSVIPGIQDLSTQKVMACAASASNDNWANAQSLTVNGGIVSGSTCGSFEAGETAGCNTAGDPTVWYKFTATATSLYVWIDHTGGGCYFGSAIYGPSTSVPTSSCGNNGPISCQSSSGGPLTQLYQLTNLTIGATYYIQVIYPAGGPCGSNATFDIQVTTANPGGTVTNKPPLTTCSSPGAGCFFNSPPAVSTVTAGCTSYPLAAAGYSANSVWSTVIQFTSSASWSNFSWQAIITSNCAGGNVVWLNWTLYDCNCNQLTCGNINTLTGNGLACGTCYRLMYQMELANCSSFTTIWPYQNVPSSPLPCTVLPIHLLYFTAIPNGKDNRMNIEWASVSEHNLREYRVMRSDDGINFRLLKRQEPIGAKEQTTKYNFEDDCCIGIQTRYYKLMTIDKDGSVSYEKTIAVTYNNDTEIVKFAPNPASDNFVMTFGDKAKDQQTNLKIFDSFGKLVREENFTAENGFKEFDIKELPSGIYFINVITPASGNELIKYKLVKQ